MRWIKGNIHDVKFPKKARRFIALVLESRGTNSHSDAWYTELIDKFPEADILSEKIKREVSKVYQREKIIFLISQLLHGDPKHYDTEEERLKIFAECLDNLQKHLEPEESEEYSVKIQIAMPYYIGCNTKEGWKQRKKMLQDFENRSGIEVLIFVKPEDVEKASKN